MTLRYASWLLSACEIRRAGPHQLLRAARRGNHVTPRRQQVSSWEEWLSPSRPGVPVG
jgi:hypothetical protein